MARSMIVSASMAMMAGFICAMSIVGAGDLGEILLKSESPQTLNSIITTIKPFTEVVNLQQSLKWSTTAGADTIISFCN